MGKDVWSSQLGFRNHRLLRTTCSSQEGVSDRGKAETQCIGSNPNLLPCMKSPATTDQCGGRWWSVWTHSWGGPWPLDQLLWHAELLITLTHTDRDIHTQTHTLTSAVSHATSPRLFLSLCHHPAAAAPLKLSGGVLLSCLSLWSVNGTKKGKRKEAAWVMMKIKITVYKSLPFNNSHTQKKRFESKIWVKIRLRSEHLTRHVWVQRLNRKGPAPLYVKWHEIQRILDLTSSQKFPQSPLPDLLSSLHPLRLSSF